MGTSATLAAHASDALSAVFQAGHRQQDEHSGQDAVTPSLRAAPTLQYAPAVKAALVTWCQGQATAAQDAEPAVNP